MEEIKIQTEFIKADAFLKYANVCATGGHAKIMIEQGDVIVNDEVCTQRGKKLRVGDIIRVEGQTFKIVSQ